MFFFFQAEDGIRDGHVTGVQTCALPICQASGVLGSRRRRLDASLWVQMRTLWSRLVAPDGDGRYSLANFSKNDGNVPTKPAATMTPVSQYTFAGEGLRPRRATERTIQAAIQPATEMTVFPDNGPTLLENASQSLTAELASASVVRTPRTRTTNPAARMAAATGQKGGSPSSEPVEAGDRKC